MTENEAKVLLCQMYLPQFDEEEKQSLTMAIQALEEIQQYRAIGTVKDFKALKEKNEPKKPQNIDGDYGTFDCPACGHTLIAIDDMTVHQNCLMCGQKLDWQ